MTATSTPPSYVDERLGLLGRKVGMMRVFTDDGDAIPVTVLDVSNNRVSQVKTAETDGYSAIQVVFGENKAPPQTWPFHMFLSVPLDTAAVEAIGEREGWRTKTFGRGMQGHDPFFHVIEFWIENRLMVEVATPDMLAEYTRLIRYDALDAHFGGRAAA